MKCFLKSHKFLLCCTECESLVIVSVGLHVLSGDNYSMWKGRVMKIHPSLRLLLLTPKWTVVIHLCAHLDCSLLPSSGEILFKFLQDAAGIWRDVGNKSGILECFQGLTLDAPPSLALQWWCLFTQLACGHQWSQKDRRNWKLKLDIVLSHGVNRTSWDIDESSVGTVEGLSLCALTQMAPSPRQVSKLIKG